MSFLTFLSRLAELQALLFIFTESCTIIMLILSPPKIKADSRGGYVLRRGIDTGTA